MIIIIIKKIIIIEDPQKRWTSTMELYTFIVMEPISLQSIILVTIFCVAVFIKFQNYYLFGNSELKTAATTTTSVHTTTHHKFFGPTHPSHPKLFETFR